LQENIAPKIDAVYCQQDYIEIYVHIITLGKIMKSSQLLFILLLMLVLAFSVRALQVRYQFDKTKKLLHPSVQEKSQTAYIGFRSIEISEDGPLAAEKNQIDVIFVISLSAYKNTAICLQCWKK